MQSLRLEPKTIAFQKEPLIKCSDQVCLHFIRLVSQMKSFDKSTLEYSELPKDGVLSNQMTSLGKARPPKQSNQTQVVIATKN